MGCFLSQDMRNAHLASGSDSRSLESLPSPRLFPGRKKKRTTHAERQMEVFSEVVTSCIASSVVGTSRGVTFLGGMKQKGCRVGPSFPKKRVSFVGPFCPKKNKTPLVGWGCGVGPFLFCRKQFQIAKDGAAQGTSLRLPKET